MNQPQARPRRVRPFQKQGWNNRLRLPLQAPRLRFRQEIPSPSSARTEVLSGLITPSLLTSPNSTLPTATVLFPNPVAPPDMVKNTPKPSTPIGATRTFRTTCGHGGLRHRAGHRRPGQARRRRGWSYGGISTDFIIAQTNHFKAAISGAGSALLSATTATINTRKRLRI